MLNSNEILAMVGAKRSTSIWSLIFGIMFTFGLGGLSSLDTGLTISNIVTVGFIGIPLLLFFIIKNKEMKLIDVDANKKPIVIMTIPSNIGLLKKALALSPNNKKDDTYILKQVFLFKTKGFPSSEIEKQIVDYLRAFGVQVDIIVLKDIENPREIQNKFENIVENLMNRDYCAVNVTPGKSTTSIILYELAQKHNIEVQYISSKYDKDNNPVDGTERLTVLKYQYLA